MKAIPVETLPQVLPPDAEEWRKLLWDAADYMERHGQCKSSVYEDADGRVCVFGAIASAAGHAFPYSDCPRYLLGCDEAIRHFEAFQPNVHIFNIDNTQHTVVTAMRRCALEG